MKSSKGVLGILALFLAFHAALFAQALPSAAPSATPFVHVPLAQAEEDYYKNSQMAGKRPIPLAALVLMGLAWGGFSLFLFVKIARSKPRSSDSKGVSSEEKD